MNKGLDALKELRYKDRMGYYFGDELETIEQELKALEIIKEIIKVFPITSREMLIKSDISKEKQDFLKEVLKQ